MLFFIGWAGGCKQQPPAVPESPSVAVPSPPSVPHVPAPPAPDAKPSDRPASDTRPSGPIEFADVTSAAGIHFKHNTGAFGKKYLPETMGSGVCVIDYDNDGWPDIFVVNSMDWPGQPTSQQKSFPALYHNNHDGTFTDVTKQAGLAVETYGQGC